MPAFLELDNVPPVLHQTTSLPSRLLLPASDFLHGPFYTGNTVSRVLNVVSVAWIATMTVIFSLPSREWWGGASGQGKESAAVPLCNLGHVPAAMKSESR